MDGDYTYDGALADGPVRGRGAGINPTNRFETLSLHVLGEHLDAQAAERAEQGAQPGRQVVTHTLRDDTRSIINRVDSPDLPFHWTVNPYRGCEHGCIYCYARPTHETLGFSSGLDFETRIMAKADAPALFKRELAHPRWKGEPIVFSGVTDCYQPLEAKLELTRQCMRIAAEARQPVTIITKNRLVLRDLDLLSELNRFHAVHVAISITTLDHDLAAVMEPRASSPAHRLQTVRKLAEASIPVTVMVAPIIPTLNDRHIPAVLKAAAEAGAANAGYTLVRLPYQIKALFEEWLARHFPDRAQHCTNLLREMRGGELYNAAWGSRMRGQGPLAEQIARTFKVFARKFGLNRSLSPLNGDHFRPPSLDGQLSLFG